MARATPRSMANGPIVLDGAFDQLRVRRANMALVLGAVAEEGRASRPALAKRTGLNKTTVSHLVADLIARGMLVETGDDENPGAVGRPAQTLRVSGDHFVALGVDVDFDRLALCVVDLAGGVRFRTERSFDTRRAGPKRTVNAVAKLVGPAVEQLEGAGQQMVHLNVAVDAVVDVTAGVVVSAPDLNWRMVPLARLLREALAPRSGPLQVENDANVAALAELWLGAGRGLRDFVYVWGSVGIGAGIISGGELFRGAHGFGGELGHITIDPNGPRCTCGRRGCLGMFAGIDVLLAEAGADPGSSPSERTRAVAQRASDGDRRALRALGAVGRSLGIGLASLANILDPEAIILGGWYAPLAQWLVVPIEEALSARAQAHDVAPCRVITSQLGEEAPTRGGAAFSLRNVFADPSAYHRRVPEKSGDQEEAPLVWGVAV